MALPPPARNATRNLALDVMRGLTLALMIVVNTPGGTTSYGPLEHALWHGFTPALLASVRKDWRAYRPLVEWLVSHVGG